MYYQNKSKLVCHGDDDDISICGNCIEDWTGIRKRKDKIKQKIEVILPIFQVSRRISLMIWIFLLFYRFTRMQKLSSALKVSVNCTVGFFQLFCI